MQFIVHLVNRHLNIVLLDGNDREADDIEDLLSPLYLDVLVAQLGDQGIMNLN
jgi:hypothetical protein